MQPAFRINIRNIPRQIPAACTRSLSSTSRNMAFLPQPQIFSPFFRLLDEVERSFPSQGREAFGGPCAPSVHKTPSFSPKVNVSEERDSYLLQAEVPGYDNKDVDIEWTDVNTLTISGRHQSQLATSDAATSSDAAAVDAASVAPSSPISEHQPTVEDVGDEDAPSKSANDEWVDLPSVETESTATTTAVPTPATTTVSQPTPAVAQQPTAKYWVKERSVGQFSRSFQFPNRVDHENVKASLKNGVLSVVVPKAKVPEKRRIVVE